MKMTHFTYLCLAGLWAAAIAPAQAQTHVPVPIVPVSAYDDLATSHDVWPSSWGPFSKGYAGISHIADQETGMKVDFSVIPGYFRNTVLVPNVRFASGYTPWQVSADTRWITYRYQLEWKDQVYTDVSYFRADESTMHIRIHAVNTTDLPQTLVTNLMANVTYPDQVPRHRLDADTGIRWVNAIRYTDMAYGHPQPTDHLVHMAYRRGEVYDGTYLDARAIGKGFGRHIGDYLTYQLPVRPTDARLGIVYVLNGPQPHTLSLSGLYEGRVKLAPGDGLQVAYVPIEAVRGGDLRLESLGAGELVINGLLLLPPNAAQPRIVPHTPAYAPTRLPQEAPDALTLQFPNTRKAYTLHWGFEGAQIRSFAHDELDIFFREKVHKHVDMDFTGNRQGHYTNVYMGPIMLPAQADTVICMAITVGDSATPPAPAALMSAAAPTVPPAAAGMPTDRRVLDAGKGYLPTIERLNATLFTNIVFPIYTSDRYIKHFTPGKNWNSLYTWDSGFIALGLNEINQELALANINAYTTNNEEQSAFLHHGSPLPIQLFAYLDLWSKTQDKAMLAYLYPRVKKMYDFLSGNSGQSTTRMPSNLIRTWDYFYNSGGWDDYPAQQAVHRLQAAAHTTPVISTAMCIRIAKILRFAAAELGKAADVAHYDADVATFAKALQQHAWNPEAGYFSYMHHDGNGQPIGRLQHASGEDYNRGLDGAFPLIADSCTPEQEERLLDHIFSPEGMWTPIGISVVDQSAPYYSRKGYWNGSVWMPHQYFVWKTMLDLGRTDLAQQIAHTALEVYHRETEASYFTFEHFMTATGRGAGWHHFSGLSTPVLSWFSAYYRTGTATTGFDTWINQQAFTEAHDGYSAQLRINPSANGRSRAMLVCLHPDYRYDVRFNGQPVAFTEAHPGLLQVALPAGSEGGQLDITKIPAI